MAAMLSASATFTTRARVTCKPRAARTAVRGRDEDPGGG
jgi:hypothetical protein